MISNTTEALCMQSLSKTMNGDFPFVFPPPAVSTVPPPTQHDFDNKDALKLGGGTAALVFLLCCIGYYIHKNRKKKHEADSTVNGSEEDLEKGNARKFEARDNKKFEQVRLAKNSKTSENRDGRFKKARYVGHPEEFYYKGKPKIKPVKVDRKTEVKIYSSEGDMESDSEYEMIHDRRSKEVKVDKDATKSIVAFEGDLQSGSSVKKLTESKNEPVGKGKAKKEMSSRFDKEEMKSNSSIGDTESADSEDEAVHNHQSKEVKLAKETTKSIVPSKRDLQSGSSDKRIFTKPKNEPSRNGRAAGFDKEETKRNSSDQVDTESDHSQDERNHNRDQSKEVKFAKDATKSIVAYEGDQQSTGPSDKRFTKPKNEPNRNGKAKKGRSAGAGEPK